MKAKGRWVGPDKRHNLIQLSGSWLPGGSIVERDGPRHYSRHSRRDDGNLVMDVGDPGTASPASNAHDPCFGDVI
jgi:hypothetical protein